MHLDHVEIRDDAGLVLIRDQLDRAARQLQRFVLHRGFLLQDSQGGEVVFHLLKAGQHRLPVGGDRAVVGGAGLLDARAAGAALKQGCRQRRPERPETVRQRQQVTQGAALRTAGGRQRQAQEVGGLGNADLRIGCLDPALCSCHVGPPFQQVRRHADRDHRHRGRQLCMADRKIRRRLADQERDRVFELGPLHAEIERLRLGRLQLRLRQDQVGLGDDAGIVLILRQLYRALVIGQRALQQVGLRVDEAQRKVRLRQLRLRRQSGRLEVAGAGLGAGALRFHRTLDPAPEIDFPARIQRQGVAVAGTRLARGRYAGGGCGGCGVLAAASARPARRQVRTDRRKVAGTRRLHQRPRFAEAGIGLRQVLVRHADLCNEAVEQRISIRLPPRTAQRGVLRLGLFPAGPAGVFLVGGWRLDGWPDIVRADRAGAQQQRQGQQQRAQALMQRRLQARLQHRPQSRL